jgi:hypothetical protein
MEGYSETEYHLLSLREEIKIHLRDISNELFSLVKIPFTFQVEDVPDIAQNNLLNLQILQPSYRSFLPLSVTKFRVSRLMDGYKGLQTWFWKCHHFPRTNASEDEFSTLLKKKINREIGVKNGFHVHVPCCAASAIKKTSRWETSPSPFLRTNNILLFLNVSKAFRIPGKQACVHNNSKTRKTSTNFLPWTNRMQMQIFDMFQLLPITQNAAFRGQIRLRQHANSLSWNANMLLHFLVMTVKEEADIEGVWEVWVERKVRKEEILGGWRKCYDELNNFYSSANIICADEIKEI